MRDRFMGESPDMLVVNNINVSRIILDYQNTFSQKNMIRRGNRVGDIWRNIHGKWLKRNRMKRFLNLFSHCCGK